jgi:hypothetical protein
VEAAQDLDFAAFCTSPKISEFEDENPLTPICPDSDSESDIELLPAPAPASAPAPALVPVPEIPAPVQQLGTTTVDHQAPVAATGPSSKKKPVKYTPGRYRNPKPDKNLDLREVINNNRKKEKAGKPSAIKTDFKTVRKSDFDRLKEERDQLLQKIASLESDFKARKANELLPVFFNIEKIQITLKSQTALVKEIERKVKKFLQEEQ